MLSELKYTQVHSKFCRFFDPAAMKYLIEIFQYDDDGAPKLLHRFASDAETPRGAKRKAEVLLRRLRGANGATITNHRGQELFNWRKD